MAGFDELFPDRLDANMRERAAAPVSLAPADSWFRNFGTGVGNYAMRSLAEAGRAVDMAGAVFPIAYDWITGDKNNTQRDKYFAEHDAVFNHAVDYWTPGPGEVGVAGQVVGQLAGGIMQAVVSPALLVGTAQLSSAEDLVRQGVDAGAANVVGDISGLGAAIGLRLPFLGNTLASRVASGVAGNVALGAAGAAASSAVLSAAGHEQQAAQYNPFDVRARVVDALLGAAFGGMAHLGARKLTPSEGDAVLVANQARHLEESAPGMPVSESDLTSHVQAMRQAIDQVLRGDPVAVDDIVRNMRMEPNEAMQRQRQEVVEEFHRIAAEEGPVAPAIDPPPLRTLDPRQADMLLPTDAVDADGRPLATIRAADALAHADAEVARAQQTSGNLFLTAANCLLGAL